MRILVLSNLYPPVVRGGYEIECHDVVEHLRGRHEVVVLTSDHAASAAPPEAGVLRELPFAQDSRTAVLRAPAAALRGVRVMRRALADVRPDLVYVWNGAGLPLAVLDVVHRGGVPAAYRVCEQWFGGIYDGDFFLRFLAPGQHGKDAAWSLVVRAVNRLPALRAGAHPPVPVAISWNSEFLRRSVPMPSALRPVLEVVVHPRRRDSETMASVPRRPRTDPPAVLFVGRVEEQKGVHVAIRAVADLERRHGLVAELVVAGGGPAAWGERLRALAAREGVAQRVRFLGELRGPALHEQVAAASAWVIPSTWDEPAGLVCTEAALARVPVVASRVGGIPEMLRDEEEALLFERGDHAGCADALARTLRGEGTQERVARALERGRELSFGPYLAAMDDFLARAAQALGITED